MVIVSPFLFNNTYGLPVFTNTPNVEIKFFYVWLIDPQSICAKWGLKRDSLQIIILVYVCSTWGIVELKTRFETWITWNDVNGVSLFHSSHLITLMAYLCSQWTPTFQIKYFMFDWSIYRLFGLNRNWKSDYLQIIIFVYVCSTWGIVEVKTRIEMWITRCNVNGDCFTLLI
jgi:hypothetical protein